MLMLKFKFAMGYFRYKNLKSINPLLSGLRHNSTLKLDSPKALEITPPTHNSVNTIKPSDISHLDKDPNKVRILIPSHKLSSLAETPVSLFKQPNLHRLSFEFLMSPHPIDTPSPPKRQLTDSAVNEDFTMLKKSKSLLECVKVLKSMRQRGVPITAPMLQFFFNRAVSHPELIRDMIFDLGINGINPTSEHYTALIRSFALKKKMAAAESVADIIRANEQTITAEMYCELMRGYARLRNFNKAWESYYRMKVQGIEQSEKTLISALYICQKEKSGKMAFSLFDQYEIEGKSLTLGVFNACIAACATTRSRLDVAVKKAFQLLKRMDSSGIRPNTETFNALLDATSNLSDFTLSLQVVSLMENRGVKKSFNTYQKMIQCIRKTMSKPSILIDGRETDKNERVDMAMKLLEELKNSNISVKEGEKAIILKEITLLLLNSGFLKRCKSFLDNFSSLSKTDLHEELNQRALRKMLRLKKVDYFLHYLNKVEKIRLTEFERRYLVMLMHSKKDKNRNREILKRCEELKIEIPDVEAKLVMGEMALDEELVYRKELERRISRMKVTNTLRGVNVSKKRKKYNWILRKHGIIKPIEGERGK